MSKDIIDAINSKEYISNIQKIYDIHFCEINEINEVINFIDLYWKKDHIFVKNRVLLQWQHYDSISERYNFVIARNKGNMSIDAILGFVPTSQFDKDIKKLKIWPCIWKVKDGLSVRGLGVSLYYFLKENMEINVIEMIGISKQANDIYRNWGFSTGMMSHYYMLNYKFRKFNILKNIPERSIVDNSTSIEDRVNFKCINIQDFTLLDSDLFYDNYKSRNYYINRFFNHPIYDYECYAIELNGFAKAIFFIRICIANNSKCVRIVDYIGNKNVFSYTKDLFQGLLNKKHAEYIDFILTGWQEKILLNAGFCKRDHSKIVVPNYFEPFVQANINLGFAHKSLSNLDFELYKADADQDRPNT